MSDSGNQLRGSNGADGSDLKRQKLSSDVNTNDNTNFGDFQLNNDQLDDILNDNVPGIDINSNPDALNFNFDNLLTDFLNDSTFGTPNTGADESVASDYASGLPSGVPSGVQSGIPSSGVGSGIPSQIPSTVPSRGASVGPSNDYIPQQQQQPKTGKDFAGANRSSNTYTNSKVSTPEVANNRSYTGSPAPQGASKVQQTPQNLNIYTGNGGINNVSAGTAVPIAHRSTPVSTTNSSTNLASTNINRSNSSVNVGGAKTSTPPDVAYKNGKNNSSINNNNINNNTAAGGTRPLIYNEKTAPPINKVNTVAQQAQGVQGLNTTNIDKSNPNNFGSSSAAPALPTTANSNVAVPYSSTPINPTGTGSVLSNPGIIKPAAPLNNNNNVGGPKSSQLHTDDPTKLNDALAAAGVDIQQEEELLMQQHAHRNKVYTTQQQLLLKQKQQQAQRQSPFLNPYHLASFMQKAARDNGVQQNFLQDGELLELMSAACENWISTLSTKTIILSRHRRRGIPTLIEGKGSNKRGSNSTTPSTQRSEISRELRNLAARQKEQEEKRVQKRIALGLENGSTGESENGKAGAEETLHRAANATATMMTMTGRKKYSWMTAGPSGGGAGSGAGAGAGDDSGNGGESEGKTKQSSIIAIRGDNGLRYREIRTGKSVTMKDLLGALEDERMGVDKALIKGYAKLKD